MEKMQMMMLQMTAGSPTAGRTAPSEFSGTFESMSEVSSTASGAPPMMMTQMQRFFQSTQSSGGSVEAGPTGGARDIDSPSSSGSSSPR